MNHPPTFKVVVIRHGPGRFKFVVRDYIGAVLGSGWARTQYLARKAGNDVKKFALAQWPGLMNK